MSLKHLQIAKKNTVPVSTRPKFKIEKKFLEEKLTVIDKSIFRKLAGNTKSIYKTVNVPSLSVLNKCSINQ
jgi:hypothetical protein